MIELTQIKIDELKSLHGELRKFSLERNGQAFVVRGPSNPEYERAIDKIGEGGRRRTEAVSELGQACIVFPDAAEVARIVATKPGVLMTAGNEALVIAGITDAFSEKL